MLLVVLLLVFVAGGVLVGSVLGGQSDWAWLSVLFSVVGAGLLVVERVRQRRGRVSGDAGEADADAEPETTERVETPGADGGELPEPVTQPSAAVASEAGLEPGEEDTDAADALVVSELDAEVLVVDERPRYHLDGCGWVGAKPTISLAVREARELGFTACGRCVPDATLARRARSAR